MDVHLKSLGSGKLKLHYFQDMYKKLVLLQVGPVYSMPLCNSVLSGYVGRLVTCTHQATTIKKTYRDSTLLFPTNNTIIREKIIIIALLIENSKKYHIRYMRISQAP